jgi:hypothetical protein
MVCLSLGYMWFELSGLSVRASALKMPDEEWRESMERR